MKKVIAFILSMMIILTVALPASAISNNTTKKKAVKKEKIKFAVWDAHLGSKEFMTIVDDFNAQSKTVQVEMADLAAATYNEKLAVILAAGQFLDGITIKDLTLYSSAIYKKQLAPLDDYIAKTKFNLSDYGSGINVLKSNGKIMALPYRSDFYITFYNKDLFDKANEPYPSNDMTWDQYRALAKKMTSGEGNNKIWGTYFQPWENIVADIATATRKGDLTSGSFGYLKPAYELVLSMEQEDKSAMTYAAAKTSSANYRTIFLSGKVAMHVMGTWVIGQMLADKKAGLTNMNWGMAKAPHFAENKAGTTVGNLTSIGMISASKKGDSVFEFMSYMAGAKGAATLGKLGMMPGYQSQAVLDTVAAADGFPKDGKAALKTVDIVQEILPHKNATQMKKILGEQNELILTKSKTIEEGLKQLDERTKDLAADK